MTKLAHIGRVKKALQILHKATKPDIGLNQIDVLLALYVRGDQGMSKTDVSKITGTSVASAAKIADGFTSRGSNIVAQAGYGLADVFMDLDNTRTVPIRINAKGRKVVEKFLAALEE